MNDLEYYKRLYEQLKTQINLVEANIAQAQVATDIADKVAYSPSTTSAGTAPGGGIPIPPGLPPAPGLLPDWPMPPVTSPDWNRWLSEWIRLNGPTGPRPGESASEYQQRRKANQALQTQFQRWRDMYWRLSQQRPMSAVQESANLIEKRFDISKFNKSKKNEKKATKDYDGDGEVESSKDEYFGSKDKAIKKAIVDKKKKKTLKEGTVISCGQISYGGFPRILNEAKGPSSADMLQDFLDNDEGGSAGGSIDPKTHAEISQHLSQLIKKGSLDQADSSHAEGLKASYELLGGKGAFAAHIEDTLERIGDQSHARDITSDQNKMYFRGNK